LFLSVLDKKNHVNDSRDPTVDDNISMVYKFTPEGKNFAITDAPDLHPRR
jgi:hypothetical protein